MSFWDELMNNKAAQGLLNLGVSAATEYFGGNDPKVDQAGYQGGIPEYEVQRERVPNIYDPNRRPGSAGRRYFTDTQFIPKAAGPALPDATGLANINAQNVALANAMPGVTAPAPTGLPSVTPAPVAPAPTGLPSVAPQPAPAPAPPAPTGLPSVAPQPVPKFVPPAPQPAPTVAPQLARPAFDQFLARTGTNYTGPVSDISERRLEALPVGPQPMPDKGELRRTEPTPPPTPPMSIADFYNKGYAGDPFEYEGRKLWNQDYPGASRLAVMPQTGRRYAYDAEGRSFQVPTESFLNTIPQGMRYSGGRLEIDPEATRNTSNYGWNYDDDGEGSFSRQEYLAAMYDRMYGRHRGQLPVLGGGYRISKEAMEDDQSAWDEYSLTDEAIPYFARGGIANLNKGMYLGGATDGMADVIPANIEGTQEARLSDGEFVMPADVVSHLGNGNSNAGAKTLYTMMDRIRKARTGTESQGKEINPNKFLPV